MKNIALTLTTLAFILAMSIQGIYAGYANLCTGNAGTQAFLTGEPSTIGTICKGYDYSVYFPASMQAKVQGL